MKRLTTVLAGLLLAHAALAADVKISALPAGTTLAGTEAIPAVQSAATVKTTPAALSTYVEANLTSADVIGKWSGTCTVSTFLRADGTCSFTLSSTEPRIALNESDAAANRKLWDLDVNASVFSMRTRTDVDGAGFTFFSADRTPGAIAPFGDIHLTNGTVDLRITEESFIVTTDDASLTLDTGGGGVLSGTDWGYDVGNFSVDSAGSVVLSGGTAFTANAGQTVQFSAGTTMAFTASAGTGMNFTVAGTNNYNFSAGNVRVATAGKGLRVAEGSNAKQGVSTLVAGTVVVSNTSVTTSSRIFLTVQSLGTVTTPSACAVSARTASTSFTILCSQSNDTSVVAWEIFEPS